MSADKARKVKLLLLDVDGVLTNGSVTYVGKDIETKSFNIKDGLGIKLLQDAGIMVGIITGRVSAMVERRAKELGLEEIVQGREDKGVALLEAAKRNNIDTDYMAYMGDDLPDIKAMQKAGFAIAPADAHADVLSVADWTATKNGGAGAVREACDFILKSMDSYTVVTAPFWGQE